MFIDRIKPTVYFVLSLCEHSHWVWNIVAAINFIDSIDVSVRSHGLNHLHLTLDIAYRKSIAHDLIMICFSFSIFNLMWHYVGSKINPRFTIEANIIRFWLLEHIFYVLIAQHTWSLERIWYGIRILWHCECDEHVWVPTKSKMHFQLLLNRLIMVNSALKSTKTDESIAIEPYFPKCMWTTSNGIQPNWIFIWIGIVFNLLDLHRRAHRRIIAD